MNKKPAKLALRIETLRILADDDVARVAGGVPLTIRPDCVIDPILTWACPTYRCGL